mmetsp:Transcript_60847/g.122083  ORF Transcript_60847/g.122083 Transcript_60847/m.122083 type:complete len:200 (-) Transcript_60847:174-773(-)
MSAMKITSTPISHLGVGAAKHKRKGMMTAKYTSRGAMTPMSQYMRNLFFGLTIQALDSTRMTGGRSRGSLSLKLPFIEAPSESSSSSSSIIRIPSRNCSIIPACWLLHGVPLSASSVVVGPSPQGSVSIGATFSPRSTTSPISSSFRNALPSPATNASSLFSTFVRRSSTPAPPAFGPSPSALPADSAAICSETLISVR